MLKFLPYILGLNNMIGMNRRILARTEAIEQIKESEGQRFARSQTEHLNEYEGMRHKAEAALGVLAI